MSPYSNIGLINVRQTVSKDYLPNSNFRFLNTLILFQDFFFDVTNMFMPRAVIAKYIPRTLCVSTSNYSSKHEKIGMSLLRYFTGD